VPRAEPARGGAARPAHLSLTLGEGKAGEGSLAERIGLRGGTRLATIEGQQLVVGGDVILSVQGAPVVTDEERRLAREALALLHPGDDLRVIVLRAGRVVELGLRIPRP
jgi:serine protease Do